MLLVLKTLKSPQLCPSGGPLPPAQSVVPFHGALLTRQYGASELFMYATGSLR